MRLKKACINGAIELVTVLHFAVQYWGIKSNVFSILRVALSLTGSQTAAATECTEMNRFTFNGLSRRAVESSRCIYVVTPAAAPDLVHKIDASVCVRV